jgi:hypothetical protein
VVVHSYLNLEIDDCKAARLLVPQSVPASDSSRKRDAWMRDQFEASQWHEGSFVKDGQRFDFSILRSYDAKRLYHHPENYFANRAFVRERRIEWVSTHSGAVPIHRVYYSDPNAAVLVAYLLVYRSSPVASPYWAQLRAAPVELFSGRTPMTLFLIQARGAPGTFPVMENVGREWLVSSLGNYRSACSDQASVQDLKPLAR